MERYYAALEALREASAAVQEAGWALMPCWARSASWALARELNHAWGGLADEWVETATLAQIDEECRAREPGPCGWGITCPTIVQAGAGRSKRPALVHTTGTGRIVLTIDPLAPGYEVPVLRVDIHRPPDSNGYSRTVTGEVSSRDCGTGAYLPEWSQVRAHVQGGPWLERHRCAWESVWKALLPEGTTPPPFPAEVEEE